MSTQPDFNVKIKLLENYLFQIDFGEYGDLMADEPAPLGGGEGPDPSRLLAASVANCLAASLLFAVRKYNEDPGELTAEISGQLGRDENNRLRISKLDVNLQLGNDVSALPHLDKALSQFENFCTITQSVRQGIEVGVNVLSKDGKSLHQS